MTEEEEIQDQIDQEIEIIRMTHERIGFKMAIASLILDPDSHQYVDAIELLKAELYELFGGEGWKR